MSRLPIALILALLWAVPCAAGNQFVLVEERYSALVITHELASPYRNWEVHRVFFVRGTKVIADRVLTEDMLLSAERGEFVLFWNDYGSCHRLVRSPVLLEVTIKPPDREEKGDAIPWWGMQRRMTDLAPPPDPDEPPAPPAPGGAP